MKTVVDLIGEFGALSDSRVRLGGKLAASDQERWEELNAFFQLLMSQSGLQLQDAQMPFPSGDLRDSVSERDRLRVPARGHAILQHEDGCLNASVVNLSRGGVFLAAETLFPVGLRTTVHLAELPGTDENEVLETEGRVSWLLEKGDPEAGLPRGMGIRFVELPLNLQERLDAIVLGVIEQRLSHLW